MKSIYCAYRWRDILANLNLKFYHINICGKFQKWMRECDGKIISNWTYSVSTGIYQLNQKMAAADLAKMKEYTNDINN